MAFMVLTLLFLIAAAIILPVFIRKKWETAISPYFIGYGVFFVFVLILEQLMHLAVLGAAGEALTGNMWLYALYGGLAAGIFEEAGRFLAMKLMMKKHHGKPHNALMYGAGHGCFEALMLVGLTMVNNLIYSAMINAGQAQVLVDAVPEEQKETMRTVISQLCDQPAYMWAMTGFERVTAIMLQISFSVLVWTAVVNKKTAFLPLAVFFHAFVDGVLVILQSSGVNYILLEAILFVLSLGIAAFVYHVWKKELHTAQEIGMGIGIDDNN